MKIAYVIPNYPAVSHTFIVREVLALRGLGVEVGTFSLRRAGKEDALGLDAEQEARGTRWLLPPRIGAYLTAVGWAAATRPRRFVSTFAHAVGQRGLPARKRPRWAFYFGEAILLGYWLHREGFAHVHCHFGHSSASVGMLAAQLADLPFSITCHGSDLIDWDQTNLPHKVSRAAFVACVSEFGREHLRSICDERDWPKLKIVRCGPGEIAETLPAPHEDGNVILCVARLLPVKGHDVLLEALASLRESKVPFHCVLVGDGPLRGELESRVAALGLAELVTFTGSQPPEAVARRYLESAVVVLSSHSEGVPVVLMEAMAHARPVVATRVGGVAELVEDGRTGILVPAGDSGALANGLRRILGDKTLAGAMGLAGRRVVAERFDVGRSADELRRHFESVQ